jgi:hypothetical protein
MSFAPDAPLAMRKSVPVDELQGLTLGEAISRYVGKRRAERNGEFATTLRDRKLRAYGRILERDRRRRSHLPSPSVAVCRPPPRPPTATSPAWTDPGA